VKDISIVYGYKHDSFKDAHLDLGLTKEAYTDITQKWFLYSMKKSKQLGYKVVLYTDYPSPFEDFVDELNIRENYHTMFWDSYKFIALEERDDNFFSIDGDVVLKNPLPDFKDDVLVDFMSLDRYKLYRNGIPNVPSSVNTLKQFEDTNVQSIFPYFDTTQQVPIPTTGVLKFNNDKKRYKYLESWKNLYKLTKDNNINPKIATSVAAEYALGCLINKNKWSYRELSTLQEGRYNSPFYKHYMGKIKFKPGIVNFDLPNASLI
jgi:hypothetical protein